VEKLSRKERGVPDLGSGRWGAGVKIEVGKIWFSAEGTSIRRKPGALCLRGAK